MASIHGSGNVFYTKGGGAILLNVTAKFSECSVWYVHFEYVFFGEA